MASSDSRPAALVTGAAGFIGSHLVRELLRLGRVRVVALDDLSGGYRHNVADSAESAFKLLEHRSYDLIITDIILPGISGIELLAKYHKINPAQKVMVITAYASLATAVEAIKAGACDFIAKPLMHDEMKRAVRKALNRTG